MGINNFKKAWKEKNFNSMIQEEEAGAEKYHNMASEFSEMATEEEGHKAKLEEMNADKSIDTSTAGPVPNSSLARQDLETTKASNKLSQLKKDLENLKLALAQARKDGDRDYARDIEGSIENCEEDIAEEMKKSQLKKTMCPNCGLESGIFLVRFGGENFVVGKNRKTCNTCGNSINKYVTEQTKLYDLYQDLAEAEKDNPNHLDVNKLKQAIKELEQKLDKSQSCVAVEQTGKQLDRAAEKAETKHDLISNIKSIQLKRQGAIINERSKNMNTFKSAWNGLNKSKEIECPNCKGTGNIGEDDMCDNCGGKGYLEV